MYSECLSALSTVGPDLLHSEHSSQANRLVIADLDIDHYFLPVQHVWSREELRPTLETLALLHLSAESLPLEKYPLLMPAPDRQAPSSIMERVRNRRLLKNQQQQPQAREPSVTLEEL